jgi:hypothetical protein
MITDAPRPSGCDLCEFLSSSGHARGRETVRGQEIFGFQEQERLGRLFGVPLQINRSRPKPGSGLGSAAAKLTTGFCCGFATVLGGTLDHSLGKRCGRFETIIGNKQGHRLYRSAMHGIPCTSSGIADNSVGDSFGVGHSSYLAA